MISSDISTSIKSTVGRDHNPPVIRNESLSSYTSRPAVRTATRDPGLSDECNRGRHLSSCILRDCFRAGCRGPATLNASSTITHAPRALTKLHTHEMGCQSEDALNSSFCAERVTTVVDRGFIFRLVTDTLARRRKLFSCRGVGNWRNRRLMRDETCRSTRGPKCETKRQRVGKP